MKNIFVFLMALVAFSYFTGCSHVRTYTVEKPRVDQEGFEGNQGYLVGQPGVPGQPARKMTRTTYVTEVEVGSSYSKKPKKVEAPAKSPAMAAETVQEPAGEAVIQGISQATVPEVTANKVTTYKVEMNDTLQKISIKVYGTSNKWKDIYEANKDQLKSPDRIYAGQILKIP